MPIIARMLAEWGDAPAGCLFLLPLWNPVLLAEQVGTLASIAAGRFIVQLGLGDDEAQFAAMGTTVRTRVSAFEQSLDAVRRLLAGEVVSASGRFTLPRRAGGPAAGRAGRDLDRRQRAAGHRPRGPAGRRLPRRARRHPAQAAEQIRHYQARCAAHGRPPAAIAVRRDIYVADSAADAEAATGAIVKAGYRGFDPSALVIGTVDEVVERVPRPEVARLHRRHHPPRHRRAALRAGVARPPRRGPQGARLTPTRRPASGGEGRGAGPRSPPGARGEAATRPAR